VTSLTGETKPKLQEIRARVQNFIESGNRVALSPSYENSVLAELAGALCPVGNSAVKRSESARLSISLPDLDDLHGMRLLECKIYTSHDL